MKQRTKKRQQQQALEHFNELFDAFVEFEKDNSNSLGGFVHQQNTVATKFRFLNKKWHYFCSLSEKNTKSLSFSRPAFKDRVEKYLELKDKETWISYAIHFAFTKYGCNLSYDMIEPLYEKNITVNQPVKDAITKSTNPMKLINVSYHRMIGKYSKTKAIPENFSELTPGQMLSFLKLSLQNMNEYELKLSFVRKNFFRLPLGRVLGYFKLSKRLKQKSFKKAYYEGWLDNSSSVHSLIKQFDFLNQPPTFSKTIVKRWRHLIGPSDQLKNISIWEFALSEKAMMDFAVSKKEADLNRLVAILYRRFSFQKFIKSIFNHVDDYRKPFSDQLIDKRLKLVSKMPAYKRYAVLTQFRSVRESFKFLFPEVYGETKKKPKDEDGNWGDVIVSMAQNPGDEEKVGEVNLYTFLYRINKLIKDQKEHESK